MADDLKKSFSSCGEDKDMYDKMIEALKIRPTAYTPNMHAFWEDAHISRQMLDAHLNTETDAATRNIAFVRASVNWIANLKKCGKLLDLGCGPGIYAELFCDAGFDVTGMDYSLHAIDYGRASAKINNKPIEYVHQNYLSLSYENAFDMITLIYCDFGVLAPDIRLRLLRKIHRALKPNGLLILDAHTQNAYQNFIEKRTVSYQNGGFWSPDEYVCVKCDCVYGGTVVLEQYNVITADALKTYNIWNELFDKERLARMLHITGFSGVSFYADVCGNPCAPGDKTICVVGKK